MRYARVISREMPDNIEGACELSSNGELIIYVNSNIDKPAREIIRDIRNRRNEGKENMVEIYEINQTVTQSVKVTTQIIIQPVTQSVCQSVVNGEESEGADE